MNVVIHLSTIQGLTKSHFSMLWAPQIHKIPLNSTDQTKIYLPAWLATATLGDTYFVFDFDEMLKKMPFSLTICHIPDNTNNVNVQSV